MIRQIILYLNVKKQKVVQNDIFPVVLQKYSNTATFGNMYSNVSKIVLK